ncbi:ATP-binding cassette domain-containing protein [Streptomyces sp. M19]
MPRGRFVAVMGPSGCGKSTLLQCAAGLDRPTAGTVRVAGTDLSALKEDELTRLRRERVGFVFQAHNLVPSLSVAENVALPCCSAAPRRTNGRHARPRPPRPPPPPGPEVPGTASWGSRPPGWRPSGSPTGARTVLGAVRRTAAARGHRPRAGHHPDIVFADEPTGALDPGTAHDVLALLRRAVDRDGRTVVMVTTTRPRRRGRTRPSSCDGAGSWAARSARGPTTYGGSWWTWAAREAGGMNTINPFHAHPRPRARLRHQSRPSLA